MEATDNCWTVIYFPLIRKVSCQSEENAKQSRRWRQFSLGLNKVAIVYTEVKHPYLLSAALIMNYENIENEIISYILL